MQKVNPDILRLKDILNAIADIEATSLTKKGPRINLLAISYSIAIIGEAINKLSKDLKQQHNYIPWQDIISMRNRIIHDYGRVEISLIIEVVQTHLPLLKQQIITILKSIPE